MAAMNSAFERHAERERQSSPEWEVLATEWDVRPSRAQAEETGRRRTVEIVEQFHPEQIKNRRRALAYSLVAVFIFAAASLVVSGYASISEVNLDNLTLQAQVDELSEEVEARSVELASKTDLVSIQSIAKEELNMDFPDNSQVRYIALEAPVVQETEKGPVEAPGFFEALWEGITDLFR